jgi:hypothetical protein
MSWISTAIAIGVGFITLLTVFFQLPLLDALGNAFREWTIFLTTFALLLGLVNLMRVHIHRIIRRDESGAGYSLIVLLTATIVFGLGMAFGLPSKEMSWVFDNLYTPLQGAFFGLVAFFLATAAYRSLRARSIESTLMLVTALIVFAGQTPLFTSLFTRLADLKNWILSVPSEAGMRGILLGVALGTIATGLRLIVGMDRPYGE